VSLSVRPGAALARCRWGPARHLATGDLPASDRAVLVDVLERARAERAAQALPEHIGPGPTLAKVAAILAKSEPAAIVSPAGSHVGGSLDDHDAA
jgi:hypothetical protein